MGRWNRLGVAVATVGMVAAGCTTAVADAGVAGAAANPPLHFYLGAAFSTSLQKTDAATEEQAARAAVSVINKQGGVLGQKVLLTTVNDASSTTTAVTRLESLINSDKKPGMVYIQGDTSADTAAVLPILKQAKLFSLSQAPTPTSTNAKLFPYDFEISPSPTNYAAPYAPYVKAHGGKSIALVSGNTAYGVSIDKAWVKQSAKAGLKIVDNVTYKSTALTFTGTLEAVEESHPDFVYIEGFGAVSGYLLQDRQKIGFTTVPVLGDITFSVSPPVTTAPPTGMLGTAAEKNVKFQAFAASVWKPKSQTPKNVQTMLTAMRKQGPIKSSLLYGLFYDAVILGSYAARAAHTTTTAVKLSKALETMKPGYPPTAVVPKYLYTSVSHSPNAPPATFAFVTPSKVVTGVFDSPGSKG